MTSRSAVAEGLHDDLIQLKYCQPPQNYEKNRILKGLQLMHGLELHSRSSE